MTIHDRLRWAAGGLAVAALAACGGAAATTAVGAGAAASAIGYENRGATSSVDVTVERLADATEGAFNELGIMLTERAWEGDGIELHGADGEWHYVVDIERDAEDTLSAIEVTVSRNVVDYSQDRAEDLLREILARI
jgi:hypothetical protein